MGSIEYFGDPYYGPYGDWTVPPGVTKIFVTASGFGGNGCFWSDPNGAVGGGGAGWIIRMPLDVTPGQTIFYSVQEKVSLSRNATSDYLYCFGPYYRDDGDQVQQYKDARGGNLEVHWGVFNFVEYGPEIGLNSNVYHPLPQEYPDFYYGAGAGGGYTDNSDTAGSAFSSGGSGGGQGGGGGGGGSGINGNGGNGGIAGASGEDGGWGGGGGGEGTGDVGSGGPSYLKIEWADSYSHKVAGIDKPAKVAGVTMTPGSRVAGI